MFIAPEEKKASQSFFRFSFRSVEKIDFQPLLEGIWAPDLENDELKDIPTKVVGWLVGQFAHIR